jgi:ATP-binding cassette subfamily B protein/subfamily B ATP-binding cassette protein MsbA
VSKVSKNRRGTGGTWKAYGQLLRYAAADRKGWAVIFALTLLTGGLSLLQPWPMKVVVDNVLGRAPLAGPGAAVGVLPGASSPRGLLAWMVAAGLVVFALNSAADVLLTRNWVRVGQGVVYRLGGDLFAHLQRRSLIFHSRNSIGDSLSRITGDSWCVYKVADTLLFTPVFAVVMVTAMAVLMAGMDLGLMLLALAVAPLMAAASFLLARPIRAAARARREAESRLGSHVHQTLSGIQVVQTFAQEQREQERFVERAAAVVRAQRRSALANGCHGLASGLITTLGTGAVLLVGAGHVLNGRLSLGGLLVFLAYLTALQGHLKTLVGLYATLQEIGAGVDRVAEVLQSEVEVKDGPGEMPALRGHVRLDEVTFGYEPDRPVLRGVSLEALPGQTVAVVGYTGAGKTTLLSLVARLFDPWHGTVSLDGIDVRSVRLESLRRQVAVVLQEPFLFPLSVAENIAYGRPTASRTEVEQAARAANAHEFIMRLPRGYDTLLGERGATLSGGERQRLAIARALLKDAPVLILDEPTSALDAQTERLLLEALRRLMAGRTTLLIAHRLSTVRHAERIVVLHEGQLVEQGSHDDLLARGGLYARLYNLQSGQRAGTGLLAAG